MAEPQTGDGVSESSDLLRAACLQVVLEAERAGQDLEHIAPRCHALYGRGAFTVHFASVDDARAAKPLTVEGWLEAQVRRSTGYPLQRDGPVPEKVLEAARAFSCECSEGRLGTRVFFRKAERLLEQLPPDADAGTREAIEAYVPSTDICVCAEFPLGGPVSDDVFTVAAKVPMAVLSEKQRDQRKRWTQVREHVDHLKKWGNEELSGDDVAAELAGKTYREALRILLESKLEDDSIEFVLRLNLAEALARARDWEGSAEEALHALTFEPQNAKGLFRRGRALLNLRRPREAADVLAQAVRVAPQDRRVRDALAQARRLADAPPSESPPDSAVTPSRDVPWSQAIASAAGFAAKASRRSLRSVLPFVALAAVLVAFRRFRARRGVPR